ncbi:MAG: hypothetical protein U0132_22885 [Gemmatimonadaceae bacterium]
MGESASVEATFLAETSPAVAVVPFSVSGEDLAAGSAVSAQLEAVLSPITESIDAVSAPETIDAVWAPEATHAVAASEAIDVASGTENIDKMSATESVDAGSATESIEVVTAEPGEVDELSLSPQSQWTTPSLEPLPAPQDFGTIQEDGGVIEAEPAAPETYVAPELSVREFSSYGVDSEAPSLASSEGPVANESSTVEASYQATVSDAASSAPDDSEPQVIVPPEAISAFDDLATVEPVAMLTALLADEREDPARERIANVLERLAARVRAGEISLGHSANVASETAVLASVLTTLLSEAL